jgi:hypothetical protein
LAALYLGIVCLGSWSAAAVAADDDWRGRLAGQMRLEQKCEVAYLTGVVDQGDDEDRLVLARVHCEDGRAFDVTAKGEAPRFAVQRCDVQVC